MRFSPLLLMLLAGPAMAQSYSFTPFSEHDLWLLGAGLDQLPPNMTRDLQQRMQAQISQQAQAFAKSKTDADKAAIDRAVAEALAKAKSEDGK